MDLSLKKSSVVSCWILGLRVKVNGVIFMVTEDKVRLTQV